IEVAKRLVNMRRDLGKSKRALLELKQAVNFNKSSISFDSIQISMPILNDTNIKNNKVQQQQQLLNKYERQIRYKKLDLLAIHILEAEQTYYRFQNLFDYELFKNVAKSSIDYFLRNSYDELNYINMNEIEQTMKMIRASSSIFTDTIHQFSDKQLQLLSRGPSYVPPCLMYILFSNESMDDIVKKTICTIKTSINESF
ncbi:unnamed protein product, partial [Rotaria sordida]